MVAAFKKEKGGKSAAYMGFRPLTRKLAFSPLR